MTPFPHPLLSYLAWSPVELSTDSFFWNTALVFRIIYLILIYMERGSYKRDWVIQKALSCLQTANKKQQ